MSALGATALFAAAWFLVLQVAAARARLIGVALGPSLGARAGCVAAALGALAVWASPSWLVAAPVGAALALVVTAALTARRRLDPDARFTPGGPGVTSLDAGGAALRLDPAGPVKAAVVLVHGTGNDRLYGFWYLIDALRGAGYRVVTAHLPGHGRGGDDRFGVVEARARIDALGAAARDDHDGPVIALGQSLGGALVLDAVARGAAFDAFVAVSAPCEVAPGAAVLRELGALRRAAVYRTLRYGSLLEVLPAAGSFRRAEFPVRVAGSGSYVDAVKRAVAELALVDRLRAAGGSLGPTLLVHGLDDGVVPVAQARALADAMGDAADVMLVPGVHHLDPLFDAALVEAVVRWLDDTVRRPRPRASASAQDSCQPAARGL